LAREQRKLAAIVAADVVGYSRLMGRDESGTLARLRKNRSEHLEPVLAKYGGRLVKLTGDGALVEFASAVDALSAAIEFQHGMAEANANQSPDTALVFRMGLHLGDLIVDGDDLYGDGVNVAARLEGEAPAGGILISRNVRDAVAGRVKATFEDLGGLSLKNIERPVRAFRVHWEALDWPTEATEPPVAPAVALHAVPTALPLPDKPSIAVLPFQNMSGDTEQEYFVDGLVEDIITALSRFKSLFVIARNSSFTYKGKAVDIKQIGRELGVRYLLEGSVQAARGRARISAQLIDAVTSAHLWADRFDGSLDDVFVLQDRVTSDVIGQIFPAVEQAEIDRVRAKTTGHPTAYDHFLRGMAALHQQTQHAIDEALKQYSVAIQLDPQFAAAYAWKAIAHSRRMQSGWLLDDAERAEAVQCGRRAIELAKDDAIALAAGGLAIAFLGRDPDAGLTFVDRAMNQNPNLAIAWHGSGWVRIYLGQPEVAIEHLMHARRLSPLDPTMPQVHLALAIACRCAGRYDEAVGWARKVVHEVPDLIPGLVSLATSLALSGQLEEARQTMSRLLKLSPDIRLDGNVDRFSFFRRIEDREIARRGALLAGMPP
jgi:adenylate cyclase